MSIIYVNGAFLPANEAKISVFDRSYLFGEGLFESFTSYDGQIPFIDDHIQRMTWSSTVLEIELPADLDFTAICLDLLKQNKLKDARFKIMVSRQGPSMAPRRSIDELEGAQVNVVIACEEFDSKTLPSGYKLKTIKSYTNDALPLSAMKTTNRLVKTLARQEALEAGFDDGILLNARGQVTETTTANIFWVDQDSQLWTIMEEQGLLPGTMKKRILQMAKDNKFTIKEGMVTSQQLTYAKEVFITNASSGIMPVFSIDKRQISGGEIGSVTAMLKDLFQKFLKESLD